MFAKKRPPKKDPPALADAKFARSRSPNTWKIHARRLYGAGAASEAEVAKLILARIRKGDLSDGFGARDIRRKEWSGLTDNDRIKAGLELLADLDWIARFEHVTQ